MQPTKAFINKTVSKPVFSKQGSAKRNVLEDQPYFVKRAAGNGRSTNPIDINIGKISHNVN
jgi:hypothetical protein